MTSINRSKTWISPEFAAEFAPEGRMAFFSESQKDTWESNKDEYLSYRKQVESTMNNFFNMQFKNSDLQKTAFETFTKTMKERLGHNEDLIRKLGELSIRSSTRKKKKSLLRCKSLNSKSDVVV